MNVMTLCTIHQNRYFDQTKKQLKKEIKIINNPIRNHNPITIINNSIKKLYYYSTLFDRKKSKLNALTS